MSGDRTALSVTTDRATPSVATDGTVPSVTTDGTTPSVNERRPEEPGDVSGDQDHPLDSHPVQGIGIFLMYLNVELHGALLRFSLILWLRFKLQSSCPMSNVELIMSNIFCTILSFSSFKFIDNKWGAQNINFHIDSPFPAIRSPSPGVTISLVLESTFSCMFLFLFLEIDLPGVLTFPLRNTQSEHSYDIPLLLYKT